MSRVSKPANPQERDDVRAAPHGQASQRHTPLAVPLLGALKIYCLNKSLLKYALKRRVRHCGSGFDTVAVTAFTRAFSRVFT